MSDVPGSFKFSGNNKKKTKMVPTRRLQKSPVVLGLVLQSDTSMLHHVAFIERKLGCP